jgi:hypothetical protein
MRRVLGLLIGLALVVGGLALPASGQQTGPWNPPPETNVDLPPGLIPFHEIGPRLREIDRASNRVKVEVLGSSVEGRSLYFVTVSDPSSFGRIGKYAALRDLMMRDPQAAMERAAEFEDFKVPFMVNASIHGNEWEGVDASIRIIERLALSNDAETTEILNNLIGLFVIPQNPDGRVRGQRANFNGFDLNRDFVTLSQPETKLTQSLIAEWNPMVLLDLHGYVGPDGLIEPTTPPHNPNYEYDLYIKWAFDQAVAMAAGTVAETGHDPVIPYRDWDPGDWDDWPPIFTPMYAMYHGAYGHTLESPLRVNNVAVGLPPEERARRADINTRWHEAAVWAAMLFSSENRHDMVLDQIELFRRGKAGEPQVPIPFGGQWGPEDVYEVTFPEAYVIPAGEGQRSDTAAARLVNFLLVNDVEVLRATRPFTISGRSYPAGSYVVDLEQPKRGLANTLLEPGYDISDRVPQMYDISGWSHALLWGATVQVVARGTQFNVQAVQVRTDQSAQGGVEGGKAGAYALEMVDLPAVQAVNHLFDLGIALQRAPDGRVVIPATAKSELNKLAALYDLDFAALPSTPAGSTPLKQPRIAAAIDGDEYFVLSYLGFDVERVSTAALNAGFDLSPFDVLMVSSGLSYGGLNPAAQNEVQEFFDSGGGLVTRGATGARFNDDAGVLAVDFQLGPACSTANGIVEVDHPASSPVAAGYPARDTVFVYDPLWFMNLASGVEVAQSFRSGDFFVSGHWLGDDEPGANPCGGARADSGQDDAAGQPSAVHGTSDEGARGVLFGTAPLFRDHPKQLFAQVANALYWVASD